MDANEEGSNLDGDPGMQDGTINISDVIEVIETDMDCNNESTVKMFNGDQQDIQNQVPNMPAHNPDTPYVVITEQPAPKALRFRYECEGRSAGSIPGASSTPENKTYPAIKIVGYKGKAIVVVSCVTKDKPYRPHPHNLVGREGCKKGVCTVDIHNENMTATFSNLGIQCVKKKEIENALNVRQEIRVDPFRTGFQHKNQPTSIDLNAVRLCFQVFLFHNGKYSRVLQPVVSDPIYDKKAMSDLNIIKLSDCVSYVDGGRKDIILLCEKVAKEDIQVRFYEVKDGVEVWEGYADFQPSQVHKQHAIWFRTPRYRTLDITEPVRVFIQLRRPSDGETSQSLPFEFLPLDSEPGALKRKRQKMLDPTNVLGSVSEHDNATASYNYGLNVPMDSIKTEPRDQTPSPYGHMAYAGGVSPIYASSTPGLSPPPQTLMGMEQSSPEASNDPFNTPYVQQTPALEILRNAAQHQGWNIPIPTMNDYGGASCVQPSFGKSENPLPVPTSQPMDLPTTASVLDMDSHELQPYMPDINDLSASFSDINIPGQDQNPNMTDSLTRLANNTIDDMFRGTNQ